MTRSIFSPQRELKNILTDAAKSDRQKVEEALHLVTQFILDKSRGMRDSWASDALKNQVNQYFQSVKDLGDNQSQMFEQASQVCEKAINSDGYVEPLCSIFEENMTTLNQTQKKWVLDWIQRSIIKPHLQRFEHMDNFILLVTTEYAKLDDTQALLQMCDDFENILARQEKRRTLKWGALFLFFAGVLMVDSRPKKLF